MEPPLEDSAEAIERIFREHADVSDAAVLAELRGLDVLPPDQGTTWERADTWNNAHILIALAAVAGERQLAEAVPLVLERMCFGDPGEVMRGVRHSLEDAVAGDWQLLAQHCEEACRSPQPGARLWAADELAVLREPRSLRVLITLLDDPVVEVAEAAAFALNGIARDHRETLPAVLSALTDVASRRPGLTPAFDKARLEVGQYRTGA